MTSSQANKVLSVIVAFTFILGMATAVIIVKAKWDAQPNLAQQTLFSCEIEDAEIHTADAVALLKASGWTATPFDHAERLYSPACNVEVTESDVIVWGMDGEVVQP